MRLGVAQALVSNQILPGDVVLGNDGVIESVGVQPAGRSGTAVPGFIDLQVNGFAGIDFLNAEPEDFAHAGRALARTGVTAYQPTLTSSSMETYSGALGVISDLLESPSGPRILGAHLEGPFLSESKAGTHNRQFILPPSIDLVDKLLRMGPVTYMTIAPELPGALEVVKHLISKKVVVACGHTEANANMARAAFNAGARAVTHIFNAQREWKPRDPGIAGAALVHPTVVVQAIADFVHLSPETILMILACTKDRFALVTDAVMLAGEDHPSIGRIGTQEIRVVDSAVQNMTGALAGSRITMIESIRNLVGLGVPLENAIRAATQVPAALVQRPDLGDVQPGRNADTTVLNERLEVTRTLVGGIEVFAA